MKKLIGNCLLLVLAILLPACASGKMNRPVLPAQPQPGATSAEKVVTLVPDAGQSLTPQAALATAVPVSDEKARETATANLRAFLNNPQLDLAFQNVESSPNASYYPAFLFVDPQGNRYYVDPNTLQPIEFTIEQPVQIPPDASKTAGELREIALQIAADRSDRFETLQPNLKYTEGNKGGENSFYRWEIEGSNVGGMPAVLQIGLKQDGTLFAYLNSLDLQP